MSNHYRSVLLLGLVVLVLVGCRSVAEVEPAAVVELATDPSATISYAVQTTNATATPALIPATSTAVPATATSVPPTDTPPHSAEPTAEATVVLASKPQFLEFYTEW